MPFFEDIRADMAHCGLSSLGAIAWEVHTHFRVTQVIQRRPWTMVRAEVQFNGLVFAGIGFARQRQYTSLVLRRAGTWLGFIPRLRVVLARKDQWNADVGQVAACVRALNHIIAKAHRAYGRWERGRLALPTRKDFSTARCCDSLAERGTVRRCG